VLKQWGPTEQGNPALARLMVGKTERPRGFEAHGLSGAGGCSLHWGTEQDDTTAISHPSGAEGKVCLIPNLRIAMLRSCRTDSPTRRGTR
jgi:hypothetical protein